MQYLLTIGVSLSICMVLVPLLIRAAPRLGMMDSPDARKVHATPVARVGGLAIVAGVLVPILLWLPIGQELRAYLLGALVLVAVGAWDDVVELGHFSKLAGQVVAVLIVVVGGDVRVELVPFLGLEPLPAAVSIPFTVVCMVGVINALNHSDGLDGLAGGECLLSLLSVGFLAYLAGDGDAVIIAMAVVGGIVGFLRFNTHPARVFMGDAGSQFLGLTLAFLVVRLTQHSNPALSMALPALIIGLPVIDILLVLVQRIYHGMHWLRASRNHLHHRLLGLGFNHHEAVIIIYSVHAILVMSALPLRYESDWLVAGFYLLVPTAVFGLVTLGEHAGWQFRNGHQSHVFRRAVAVARRQRVIGLIAYVVVSLTVPLYLIGVSVSVAEVPRDFGVVSAVLSCVLVLDIAAGWTRWSLLRRVVVYVLAFFSAWLVGEYPSTWQAAGGGWETLFLALMAAAIAAAVRYGGDQVFRLTPMDYLVMFVVVGVAAIPRAQFPEFVSDFPGLAVRVLILVYAAELMFSRGRARVNGATMGALGAALILAWRGLA